MAAAAEPIVGRAAELAVLDAALGELDRRRWCAVEVAGEPGIGKTRLLTELAAGAENRGHLVLRGSASEFERELPFGIFVDALDAYVHALGPAGLATLDDDVRGSWRKSCRRCRPRPPAPVRTVISGCAPITPCVRR